MVSPLLGQSWSMRSWVQSIMGTMRNKGLKYISVFFTEEFKLGIIDCREFFKFWLSVIVIPMKRGNYNSHHIGKKHQSSHILYL